MPPVAPEAVRWSRRALPGTSRGVRATDDAGAARTAPRAARTAPRGARTGIRGGRGILRPGALRAARAGAGSRTRRGVLVICHESMVTGATP
ncbi:hypothetical protein KE639_04480 [Streptomyces sp. V17-9]|nr:hypothetical protein KE639_04480 [Streptomyces sp. V17-9]